MSDKTSDFQLQSYIFTASRYNFSVYEKRILYRMIEIEQKMFNQQEILKNPHKIETNLWGDRRYTFPVKFLLSTKDEEEGTDETINKNNARVIKALNALNDKKISEGKTDGTTDYWSIRIIDSPQFKKGERYVSWKADSKLIEMIMDFSKGWRAYELNVAFNLQSQYAMRLYELIANKKKPITYSIDELVKMFCLENKYIRKDTGKHIIGHIENKVILKAQKELDKISPYTFSYAFSPDKSKVTFFPIYQENLASAKFTNSKNKEIVLSEVMTEKEYETYTKEFGFTEQGLKNNYDLFLECKQKLPENYSFFLFQEIRTALGKKGKNVGAGYVVNIIRNQLEQWLAK